MELGKGIVVVASMVEKLKKKITQVMNIGWSTEVKILDLDTITRVEEVLAAPKIAVQSYLNPWS